MEYPREFSRQARARVEGERLKAIQEFEQERKSPVPSDWTPQRWDQCTLYAYILRVFLVFAREACQLGRDGVWTVDQVREEAEGFLRVFAMESYYERGRDRTGARLPNILNRYNEDLRSEVYSEFRASEEWNQFERGLLTLAELQGSRAAAGAGRSFSESQQRRLTDAERELDLSLGAREKMRALLESSQWSSRISPPIGPRMGEDLRTLDRDIKKYATTVLNVLAEASWHLGSVESLRNHLEVDACDILTRVRAKLNPVDLRFLEQGLLEKELGSVVTRLIGKAQREFPAPWLANVAVQNPPEGDAARLTPPMDAERPEQTEMSKPTLPSSLSAASPKNELPDAADRPSTGQPASDSIAEFQSFQDAIDPVTIGIDLQPIQNLFQADREAASRVFEGVDQEQVAKALLPFQEVAGIVSEGLGSHVAEAVQRLETALSVKVDCTAPSAATNDSRTVSASDSSPLTATHLRLLREAMDREGLNPPKLALKMQGILKRDNRKRPKVDRATIYRIMHGHTKKPQPEIREAMIKALALKGESASIVRRGLGGVGAHFSEKM
jgi:hypothetical protein